jgi:hypothetical protein
MTALLTLLIFLFVGFVLWFVYFKPEPIPKKESPHIEPLVELHTQSVEEHFALAIADLEYTRLEQTLEEVTLVEYLKEQWQIELDKHAKEQTIYALQQLYSIGTVDLLLQDETMRSTITIKSMIAFDSAVYAELIRQTMSLNILSEEEGWGLLFLNAQRVQDSFTSWEMFQEAYLEGAAFWLSTQKKHSYKKLKLKLEKNKIQREWLDTSIFTTLKTVPSI